MKKRSLLAVVLLLAGAVAFGDTGALGNKWLDKETKKPSMHFVERDFDDFNIGKESRVILQKKTDVYYFYANDGTGLLALAYYVMPEQKEILKSKLTLVNDYTNRKTNILEGVEFEEHQKAYVGAYLLVFNSILGEFSGDTSMSVIQAYEGDKAEGTLSIYDYNSDTRVYIYENIIEGETVVVYVPHEQDY